jgi:hypothetical protein
MCTHGTVYTYVDKVDTSCRRVQDVNVNLLYLCVPRSYSNPSEDTAGETDGIDVLGSLPQPQHPSSVCYSLQVEYISEGDTRFGSFYNHSPSQPLTTFPEKNRTEPAFPIG